MNKEKELKELGRRIKALRKERNMTQFDLASRINKDQQSIQRLEAGRVNPSYAYLLEISEGLNTTLTDILRF